MAERFDPIEFSNATTGQIERFVMRVTEHGAWVRFSDYASLQQQLSDYKSVCDTMRKELAVAVAAAWGRNAEFEAAQSSLRAAEAALAELRRQRNDISVAWDGADARAKTAEQELAETRGWVNSYEREKERWIKDADARIEAAEAREKQVRAETIEECLRICDHANLHYKGPVAVKIRREIAVLLSIARALASKEGGNG